MKKIDSLFLVFLFKTLDTLRTTKDPISLIAKPISVNVKIQSMGGCCKPQSGKIFHREIGTCEIRPYLLSEI